MDSFTLISKFTQIYDPDWPQRICDSLVLNNKEEISVGLCSFDFDFESWLYYKLRISNADPSEYVFRYPNQPHLFNFEEYRRLAEAELLEDDTSYRRYHFFSPTLSPQIWEQDYSHCGIFEQQAMWLRDQWNWIREGFPAPPEIIWHSEFHLRKIGELLLYNPYLDRWRNLSQDFSIKISDHFDRYDDWCILQILIWMFQEQGNFFPSPALYSLFTDQLTDTPFYLLNDSMLLPQGFWDWVKQMITEELMNDLRENSEKNYLNMLHVWEEIILSTLQRKNYIDAFTQGIAQYSQFLDERYDEHLQITIDHKLLLFHLLEGFLEAFPSGFISGGTFLFELRTDDGSELYDKLSLLYFVKEEESVFLGDPFISKFDSDRLFSTQETPMLSLQLTVTEIDQQNNEFTLAIIKDSYPTDFIELFKPLNDDFEGLHDIEVLLGGSSEKVVIFDLRERNSTEDHT